MGTPRPTQNNRRKARLSPATPILINSPPPSPTHLRTANASNHRHTRPALPPLFRRPDDGLDHLTLQTLQTKAYRHTISSTYHFRTTSFSFGRARKNGDVPYCLIQRQCLSIQSGKHRRSTIQRFVRQLVAYYPPTTQPLICPNVDPDRSRNFVSTQVRLNGPSRFIKGKPSGRKGRPEPGANWRSGHR